MKRKDIKENEIYANDNPYASPRRVCLILGDNLVYTFGSRNEFGPCPCTVKSFAAWATREITMEEFLRHPTIRIGG